MAASYHPLGHDPATAAPNAVAGIPLGARPVVRPGRVMRSTKLLLICTMLSGLIAVLPIGAVLAQSASGPSNLELPPARVQAPVAPRIGGDPKTDPCVAVDIAGRRAGDADCAAQRLQDAAKAAQDRAKNQPVPNIPSADAPDTEIGVANQ